MHQASVVPAARVRGSQGGLRRLVVAIILLALVAVIGYSGYVAVVAADWLVRPYWSKECTTPMAAGYGWTYEAINYDPSGDDASTCQPVGPRAGEAVIAEDGTRIAGWYIPAAAPDPARPTVLLVHGHDSNKSGMLPIAAALHGRYDLVVIDLRAAGYSGGDEQTLGVREQLDVTAMVDWIEANKAPQHIAAVGVSGGAAATLAHMRTDPRIGAVVADSMHARFQAIAEQYLENEGQPPYPGAWAATLGIRIRTGADLATVDPIDSLAYLGDRPLLLLHGTADQDDIPAVSAELNLAEAQRLGADVELQYCEGAGHAGVIQACGAEYGTWVSTFLDDAFAN